MRWLMVLSILALPGCGAWGVIGSCVQECGVYYDQTVEEGVCSTDNAFLYSCVSSCLSAGCSLSPLINSGPDEIPEASSADYPGPYATPCDGVE